jgi:hypothetical protein
MRAGLFFAAKANNVVAVTSVKSPHSIPAASLAQKASPEPALFAWLALLLAAGGLLLYGFRSRRSRMAHRPQPGGGESILPARRSLLFPPSHHETLHDPAYLDRILRAELADQPHPRQSPDTAEAGADRTDAAGRR